MNCGNGYVEATTNIAFDNTRDRFLGACTVSIFHIALKTIDLYNTDIMFVRMCETAETLPQ